MYLRMPGLDEIEVTRTSGATIPTSTGRLGSNAGQSFNRGEGRPLRRSRHIARPLGQDAFRAMWLVGTVAAAPSAGHHGDVSSTGFAEPVDRRAIREMEDRVLGGDSRRRAGSVLPWWRVGRVGLHG